MPLKLKKYDGITALDTAHPLYSKVDRFILFDAAITDLKSGQVYTTTAAEVGSGDPLGSNVRQFDASGDVLSPSVPIPFPSTVLMIYRQYGSNSLGGGDTAMIRLFAGDMFALDAGNWSNYDYQFTRRGSFGTVFYTYFKPYRVGLNWDTQQAEITARRQQAHCTAIDYVSGSTSFWQDGVQHMPTSGDTSPVFTPSTNPVSVQISQTVASGKEWMLAGFVVFNTTLTDAEKESITQEPWELTNGVEPVEASISSALTPGATITATLTNYPSLPATVTIADSLGNDIVLPLTATGATTTTFTVPSLATSNAGQEYLQFGAVNLTFGTKTISSTFSPVSPLTSVTLIAPVATNAFEDWGVDVPVAGEQLISEGNFDINGNFTGADPEATYTCWITRLNGDNHRFTIRQSSRVVTNIILKNLTPKPRYGEVAPLVDTDPLLRFGFRPPPPEPPPTGVIMALDFNSAPDWHSEMYADALDVERFASQGNILPVGAYAAYMNHQWTPARGYPDKQPGAAILAANADKSFSGTGKSYVVYRHSNSDDRPHVWNSDDQLTFSLSEEVSQIYIEFMIRFDPAWTTTGNFATKLFRAGHWNGDDNAIFSGFLGGLGPMAIVDYVVNEYGVRNVISFRGGPPGTNYMVSSADIGAALGPTSELDMNFSTSLAGQSANGGNPVLPDKQNGGNLPTSGIVTHNQVYGTPASAQWTKIAFFTQLNSAPGVKDGKFFQWFDNKRILTLDEVCWYREPASGPAYIPKLNFFSIGGNDWFHTYPDEDHRTEWLSYDNVIVRHDIPAEAEQ